MTTAITREVSPAMGNCELTHLSRQPIDIGLASRQHHTYQETLTALGCQVQCTPAEPDLPDSVFVEDTAVIFDEIAIITRPGAVSRRPEITSITPLLQLYRPLRTIEAPGTMDGGDVLCIGKNVYIGLTSRSNAWAIKQMQAILSPIGYTVYGINISGVLHLKSAVTQLSDHILLINPNWVNASLFGNMQIIEVSPHEIYAANALWIGEGVIYPSNFPRTQECIENALEKLGIQMYIVDISEFQKAEGAVTCCSLIIKP